MDEPSQLQAVAISAAKKAGEFIQKHFGKIDRAAIQEKEKNDFVTLVDKGAEEIIINHIHSHYPQHSILAEESGSKTRQDDNYRWIIDPLDGTTNFIRQIPICGPSVAVMKGEAIIAGAVYNPMLNELFSARRGAGATLNGSPISISQSEDFSKAFIATGFPHHRPARLPAYLRAFEDIFLHSAGARRLGSAALDLCYTACGKFEAFWETGLSPWDVAAGALIIQEAGGVVSDFSGGPDFLNSGYIAAGNPKVHNQLVNILSYHFKEYF